MDLDNDSSENSAEKKGSGLTTVGLKKSIAETGAKPAADGEEKKDEAAAEAAVGEETKQEE